MNINYHDSVNFGDALNVYLAEKIKPGQEVNLVTDDRHVMMIGSILAEANLNTIVWGAGLGSFSEQVQPCDVRAVRGPLSGMKCRAVGLECDTFGDPALLLPRFFNPKVEKKYEIGIIPHFIDWYSANHHFKGERIINILQDTESVIEQILECKTIVSSCLHGLITAEAYGIPTAHITFGNHSGDDALSGDGFKFYDYYMSIGVTPKEPTRHDRKIYPTKKKLKIDLNKLLIRCPL